MSVTQINVSQSRYRFPAKSDGVKRGLCTQLILCVLALGSNPYCILPFRKMILAGIYEVNCYQHHLRKRQNITAVRCQAMAGASSHSSTV